MAEANKSYVPSNVNEMQSWVSVLTALVSRWDMKDMANDPAGQSAKMIEAADYITQEATVRAKAMEANIKANESKPKIVQATPSLVR